MIKLRRFYYRIFPHYRRLEIRIVTYEEGDELIHDNYDKPESDQWVIAKEEDANFVYGMVFLERRERIVE